LAIPLKFKQGQIYWLEHCPPLDGRDEKKRPVIVMDSPGMLKAGDRPNIVACTTHPRRKDQPRFEIPPRGEDPQTGLPETCWAVPRWYFDVNRFA
jgi:hypothetical protein